MLRACVRLLAVIPLALVLCAAAPLTYTAYDGWNAFAGVQLSSDGAWLAYGVAPEDGDGTLVVRNNASGKELREPRGKDPQFNEAATAVFYTIAPAAADLDAARRAHKKPADQPKSGFGILTLPAGTATSVEQVKSHTFAKHGSRYVAYLLEPSPAPSHSPAPAPSPTASASPVPENKKKTEGSTLTLRDLQSGEDVTIADVTEYHFSDDERYLAYAVQSKSGVADGVYVRDLHSAQTTPVSSGEGRYAQLAFAPKTDALAFESDRSSYASAAPHYDLYLWKAGDTSAHDAVTESTAGLPRGWSADPDGGVQFSKDGSVVFLGANLAPAPMPSGTPEPMAVDLWNWRDARLQSEQKVEADQDRKRTYLGALHVESGKYVQLGSPSLEDTQPGENARFVLGANARPYEKQRSWDDFYDDEYAVNVATGAKTRGTPCARPTAARRTSRRTYTSRFTTNSTTTRLRRRRTATRSGRAATVACC